MLKGDSLSVSLICVSEKVGVTRKQRPCTCEWAYRLSILESNLRIWFEGAPLSYHTNEDLVSSKIQEWLQKYDDTHECRRKSGNFLPTRVIDVGVSEGRYPRIYIPRDGERGEYLALSNCWGGPQKSTTTLDTRQANLRELVPEALPKTVWDAIQVTQKLGLHYLWVDALCILQDCPQDMSQEIHCMGTIHKNDVVTIAAVDAATSDSDFLGNGS